VWVGEELVLFEGGGGGGGGKLCFSIINNYGFGIFIARQVK